MEKRIIRKPELFRKIGLSDASVWRLERMGRFPGRIALGGNSVGWVEQEINEWLENKLMQRRPNLPVVKFTGSKACVNSEG